MASKTCKEKRTENLTEKFAEIRAKALQQGISDSELHQSMKALLAVPNEGNATSRRWKKILNCMQDPAHRIHMLMVLLALSVGALVASYELLYDYVLSTPCLLDSNHVTDELYRPRVDCSMCRDVQSVPEERNLSQNKFYTQYAFTGRPVLVKQAISNWTAMSHFSFKFFQKLYRETEGALAIIEEDCQFFPYGTEFITLSDALGMSDERATFQPGELPWYIGWSNCHDAVGKKLRQYYERPYFLPADSESVAEDWIFMGGPGPGANIHLDYVERPSWQAQISGQKTWQLVPSPECEAICHSFNVTVHKGDIIVVDTNIWYHSTYVHPGEISITIGSEFD